jgi:hypothetical protein
MVKEASKKVETKRSSGGKKTGKVSMKTKSSSSLKVQRKKNTKSNGIKKLSKVVFDQRYIQAKLAEAAEKYGYPSHFFSDEGKDAIIHLVEDFTKALVQAALRTRKVRTKNDEKLLSAKDLEIVLSLMYPELLAC